MPNRIIKESIAKSEKVNGLTDFQFRLWVHLMTYVEDYGRGDARAAVIKGTCFPFRERLTNRDIEKGLADLADAGCVGLYKVDGKPYLYLPNWEQHQRVRSKISKCPAPVENNTCPQLAATCGELKQNAPVIQNPESRIQNPESRGDMRAHEADFDGKLFTAFWDSYPRKIGRESAWEAWKSLSPDDAMAERISVALESWKASSQWTEDDGRYIPSAEKFLKDGYFNAPPMAKRDASQSAKRELDADEVAAVRRLMEEA